MTTFHDFNIKNINAEEMNFEQFADKVVLVVNVASKCGLTPQYSKLEELYKTYRSKGLEIVGLPCNQFMGQEPGSDEEIQQFCSSRFDVSFPMTTKVDVNGEQRHPLYDFLAGDASKFPGDIQWNFEKFLVAKNGELIGRFSPKAEPDDQEIIKAIDAAL